MEWHLPGVIAPSSRTPAPRFVTDVVVELGLAAPDDVHGAVEAARASGGRPETMLVRTGALDDERLAVALAERYGLDRLDLDHFPVDGDAARLVGVDTALRHEALPVAHVDGGRLLVAVADPAAGPAANAIAAATGREVVAAVAPRGRLRALIEAAASRAPVAPPAAPAPHHARPGHDGPPATAEGHDRIAELERELAGAHAGREDAERRAASAEERTGAATQRILELETELAAAHATLAAVRHAVGTAG